MGAGKASWLFNEGATAGDAGDLLVIDDRVAVERTDGGLSPDERDVVGLPYIGAYAAALSGVGARKP